jgi:hypothetical protein
MHKARSAIHAIHSRSGSDRVSGVAALLCCLSGAVGIGAAIGYGQNVSAQASVYRCTAPDGSVEFRQRACQEAHTSTQVQIEDNRTGWVPPPGEEPATAAKKKRTKERRSRTVADDKEKNADRCWSKRQQIERVNAELRAGYKPQRGVKLRRRRSEYEEYLSRYCR